MRTLDQDEEELRETAFILYCKFNQIEKDRKALLEYSQISTPIREKWIALARYGRGRFKQAKKEALLEAAEIKLPEFVMPTGYSGTRQVLGIHFQSGNAHGVAEYREAILTRAREI